jgi:AraC-like DNA-binding protein
MFHKIYQPHPALRGFINNIMIQYAELDPSKPKPVFPMPPLQEQVLVFYPFDPVDIEYPNEKKKVKSPPSIIVGRRVQRVNLHLGYHHLIVQVGFQPGGLYRLLGIPMNEFGADESYESTLMLDKEITFITEQLREVFSFEEIISIVEGYLFRKADSVKKSLPIDKALQEVIQRGGLVDIDYIASQACLSIRQLERLFQQRIGVPPKFFARLIRFSKAWIMKENTPTKRWIDIAYECGYFDQMHLIHDFKEFTGVTPTIIESSLADMPFRLGHKLPF